MSAETVPVVFILAAATDVDTFTNPVIVVFPAANVVIPEIAPVIVPPDNIKNVELAYATEFAYAKAALPEYAIAFEYAVETSVFVASVK